MSTQPSDHDWEDDHDYEMADDEDDGEPIGSCDKCETNLYECDCYQVRGLLLCGQCAWRVEGGA